ncbi:MAG: hypothetical protein Q7R64_00320 [bacterium]|nr:hypothetical protein [bacterium]
MATDFSPSYVARAAKNLHWKLRLALRFAPWIKRWRLLRLRFGSRRVHTGVAIPKLTENLEAGSAHFKEDKWAFMENIFPADFYRELLVNWPKKRYLEPPREVAKSYNTGFGWIHDYSTTSDFSNCDPRGEYPILLSLLNYLRSSEISSRVTAFAGTQEPLVLYSFILTDAGTGAEVVPHKDSSKDDPRAKYLLNFIFFIDATGGKNTGALTLSRDNELTDIMFEAPRLQNTCLAYDILGDFYHGFPPIAPGKWRWVITAQFCQKSYVEKTA